MPVFKSQLDPRSADFKANAERMKALVADLREKVAKITMGGDEASRQKHVARGKLLPRERVRTRRRCVCTRFPHSQLACIHVSTTC